MESAGARVIGPYEIHDAFASGTLATVHLGRVRGSAGFTRVVAVKKVHAEFARDPQFVATFVDEVRGVARVRHPSVAPVLDVVAQNDELFEVMEYVHGGTLGELLSQGVLSAAGAAAIAVDVLEGLHAAHEARGLDGQPLGIVHGSVAPENVVVCGDGVARLVAFGTARARRAAQAAHPPPPPDVLAYMAPEQLRAFPSGVDRRADVYAASVLLWEMLARQPLFGAAATEAGVVARVLAGDVPALRSIGVVVPEALESVLRAGLAPDPAHRPPTAAAMASALEAAVVPAKRPAIASWVAECAGVALQKRAEVVGALQRGEMPPPMERPRTPSSGSMLAAAPYGATAGGAPAPPLATSFAGAGALFGPMPGERPRPQGTSPWIGVIVLVAIVGMFLWYEYAHKHATDHGAKQGASATPAATVAH